MAEDQDRLQKTEEPTQRRLDEARRKGQVAHSREVNHVLILGAGTLFAGVLAAPLAGRLGDLLRPFLSAPHQLPTDPAGFAAMIVVFATKVGGMMLLPALLFVAAALAAGLIQNGWVVSAAPLVPKAERLSPLAGMKRLFSLRQLVEFLKGIAKIALVGAAATLIMWSAAPRMLASVSLEAGPLAAFLGSLSLRLLGGITVLIAAMALLDVAYQRFEHRQQLRMSRRDLQDEFKQTEGDPFLKARLKGLRMERARRRMMAAVPDATVVITNPTHYAVALRYQRVQMAAPQLVAKGVDSVAQRIRELAREHHVPVIENPPLARALHGGVELGAEIPQVHYQAVAEVIGHVMRLKPTVAR